MWPPSPIRTHSSRALPLGLDRTRAEAELERGQGEARQYLQGGNRYLRQLLVVGAMAVIRYAERNGTRRPWLVQLMARRTTKVAAVALANKTARMIWALMTGGERYREPVIA